MKQFITRSALCIVFIFAASQTALTQFAFPVRLGILGGINLANQSSSKDLFPANNPKSFHIGSIFGAMAELSFERNWSIQVEPRFIQKGTNFGNITVTRTNPIPSGTTDAMFRLNYFELPLLIKAKFEEPNFNPFVLGGPTFGFINSAKVEAPGTHVLSRPGTSTLDIEGDVSSLEVGLEIGGGVEFALTPTLGLLVMARYSQGLLDVYSNPIIPSTKSYGISITTGLLFNLIERVSEFAAAAPEPIKDQVDSDGDGLFDNDEIRIYKTNPYNSDSDGDGLTDGDELQQYKTNPLNGDTDEDGLTDDKEVLSYKTNPLDPDTDHGSITDGQEVNRGSDPLLADDDLPKIKAEPELEVGKSIVLEGIVFQTSKSEITSTSAANLEKAFNILYQNPEIAVEIRGHTDNVGNHNYNLKLSLSRAEAVREYLVRRGIDPQRISSRGFGFAKPIVPNDTPEGRQKNRRIEFYRVR